MPRRVQYLAIRVSRVEEAMTRGPVRTVSATPGAISSCATEVPQARFIHRK
jgi:hypothetical protein